MSTNTLVVDGETITARSGYVQLGDTLGAYCNGRLGFQLETTRAWDGVLTWNGGTLTHLGPRSRRTLRFNEAIPTPYYVPGHGTEDFRDGGLHNMDLCGALSTPRDWDNVHARCPVFGLIDIVTGKPRALASIALPAIGIYSLGRYGPTSELPEFGKPDEIPYDGQHDLRRSRWTAPADEFGIRDQQAVARDMALAWSRKYVNDRILKGPKNQGSKVIGREFAFVSIACADAKDETMIARLRAVAEHVQHPYGNLQISNGGNPAPPDNEHWFSDAEAHYLTVALFRLGLKRAARRQADVAVANGRTGKYIEIGTGRGAQAPTDATSWGAMGCGVYTPSEVKAISARWKIGPDFQGGMHGPYKDPAACLAKLVWWNQEPKTRTAMAALRA